MPEVGPGIKVPLGPAVQYEKDLRRLVLNPLFRRMKYRLDAAGKTYEKYREVFRAIPDDPSVQKALLEGGTQAANMQAARLHAYHKRQWESKMRRYMGVNIIPAQVVTKPLVDSFIADNVALIKTIPSRMLGKLTGDLQVLADTKPFDESAIAKVVGDGYGSSGYNLRRISRDQTNKLIGQFTEARQTAHGVEKYVWSTSGDNRVRATHVENDGLEFAWDEPPEATGHPGHDIQCFPGSVRILPAGLKASVSYRYIGQLIKVSLTDGVNVTMTPNHPVLTKSGWKSACSLDEGDKLLQSCAGKGFSTLGLNPNLSNGNPLAEQLHRLLGGGIAEGGAQSRAVDLHGNPARSDEEIEIVSAPCELRNGLDALGMEVFGNIGLELANVSSSLLPHEGSSVSDLGLPSSVPDLLVGSSGQGSPLFRSSGLHSDEISFPNPSGSQSQINQAGLYEGSADSKIGGHLFDRLLGMPSTGNSSMKSLAPFKVVVVARRDVISHDGPVYSFETASGLIVANGIVTHNCRCVALPIIPTPGAKKRREAALQSAESPVDVVPKPTTKPHVQFLIQKSKTLQGKVKEIRNGFAPDSEEYKALSKYLHGISSQRSKMGSILKGKLDIEKIPGFAHPPNIPGVQIPSLRFQGAKVKVSPPIGGAPPAPPPVPVSAPSAQHLEFDSSWKQISGQAGSNPGGLYEDPSGTKWYVKFMNNEDRVANELAAADLYRAAGVDVPDLRLLRYDGGKAGIASKIEPVTKQTAAQLKALAGVRESFTVDAWLANWDVIGLEYDNLLKSGGKAFRLDTGGALAYRAQGSLKGAQWADEVQELTTLLNPNINPTSAKVFENMSQLELVTGAKKVASVTEDQIRGIVAARWKDADRAKEMGDRIIARRKFLLEKFPDAKPGGAQVPAPAPAPVPAAPVTGAGTKVRRIKSAKHEEYYQMDALDNTEKAKARYDIGKDLKKFDDALPDVDEVAEADSAFWKTSASGDTKIAYARLSNTADTFSQAEIDQIMANVHRMMPERLKRFLKANGIKIQFKTNFSGSLVLGDAQSVTGRVRINSSKSLWKGLRASQKSPEQTVIHELMHTADYFLDKGFSENYWEAKKLGNYGVDLMNNAKREVLIRRRINQQVFHLKHRSDDFDFTFRSYEGRIYKKQLSKNPGKTPAEYITVNAEHYFPARNVQDLLKKVDVANPSFTQADRDILYSMMPKFRDAAPVSDKALYEAAFKHSEKVLRKVSMRSPHMDRLLDYLYTSDAAPKAEKALKKYQIVAATEADSAAIKLAKQEFQKAREELAEISAKIKAGELGLSGSYDAQKAILRAKYQNLLSKEADLAKKIETPVGVPAAAAPAAPAAIPAPPPIEHPVNLPQSAHIKPEKVAEFWEKATALSQPGYNTQLKNLVEEFTTGLSAQAREKLRFKLKHLEASERYWLNATVANKGIHAQNIIKHRKAVADILKVKDADLKKIKLHSGVPDNPPIPVAPPPAPTPAPVPAPAPAADPLALAKPTTNAEVEALIEQSKKLTKEVQDLRSQYSPGSEEYKSLSKYLHSIGSQRSRMNSILKGKLDIKKIPGFAKPPSIPGKTVPKLQFSKGPAPAPVPMPAPAPPPTPAPVPPGVPASPKIAPETSIAFWAKAKNLGAEFKAGTPGHATKMDNLVKDYTAGLTAQQQDNLSGRLLYLYKLEDDWLKASLADSAKLADDITAQRKKIAELLDIKDSDLGKIKLHQEVPGKFPAAPVPAPAPAPTPAPTPPPAPAPPPGPVTELAKPTTKAQVEALIEQSKELQKKVTEIKNQFAKGTEERKKLEKYLHGIGSQRSKMGSILKGKLDIEKIPGFAHAPQIEGKVIPQLIFKGTKLKTPVPVPAPVPVPVPPTTPPLITEVVVPDLSEASIGTLKGKLEDIKKRVREIRKGYAQNSPEYEALSRYVSKVNKLGKQLDDAASGKISKIGKFPEVPVAAKKLDVPSLVIKVEEPVTALKPPPGVTLVDDPVTKADAVNLYGKLSTLRKQLDDLLDELVDGTEEHTRIYMYRIAVTTYRYKVFGARTTKAIKALGELPEPPQIAGRIVPGLMRRSDLTLKIPPPPLPEGYGLPETVGGRATIKGNALEVQTSDWRHRLGDFEKHLEYRELRSLPRETQAYFDENGVSYTSFNRNIREGKELVGFQKKVDISLQASMRRMDNDYLMFRGEDLAGRKGASMYNDLKNLRYGDEWVARQYMSTSADATVSTRFGKTFRSQRPVFYQIKVGKGSRGIMTSLGSEQEILLSRGQKFRVANNPRDVRFKDRGGNVNTGLLVELEVIP